MYIRIRTITMKHSTKRRTLRLSISPTPLRREVANRLSTARLSPGLPGGLLKRLASFYTLRCVLSIHTDPHCARRGRSRTARAVQCQNTRESTANTAQMVRIRRGFARFAGFSRRAIRESPLRGQVHVHGLGVGPYALSCNAPMLLSFSIQHIALLHDL